MRRESNDYERFLPTDLFLPLALLVAPVFRVERLLESSWLPFAATGLLQLREFQ
ncbi:hypothetical protein D3C80_2040900 [compost metagenome]